MSGETEFGKCDICKAEKPLSRVYYEYDLKCDCCNGKDDDHFEIVRHCKDCTPIPPRRISAVIKPKTP